MYHLNSFKTKLIPLGLAISFAGAAHAQFVPIPLTPGSYNQDMIVEKPADVVTTASVDNGTANTQNSFYEKGFNLSAPNTGLPLAGSSFTSSAAADHSYTMAPSYTANDAVLIDQTVTSATLTLTTPSAYSALSFLACSGNGATTFGYTVHYQDGSFDTGTFVAMDWFFNSPIAFSPNGRVDVNARTMDNVNNNEPRLYTSDITLLNTTSPVTSIDLTYSAGTGHGFLFAVSGSTGSGFSGIAVTGYNVDAIVEKSALALGRLTTASMDNALKNTGNGWYAQGFDTAAPSTGLPVAGTTIVHAALSDHSYTFAPSYASNNVIYLDPTHGGTLTLAAPTNYSSLSFLLSAAHGPIIINTVTHHADSTSENSTFSAKDWFNNTPIAFNANGRVSVDSGVFDAVNGGNPRLYSADIALGNVSSPVTSIDVSWNSGTTNGVVALFALSGTAGAVPPAINIPPTAHNGTLGSTVQFTSSVGGTAPLLFQWQKGDGVTFTNLADGGNISGSATTNLSVSSLSFADAGAYRLFVTNSVGSVASPSAHLGVISIAIDVTSPGDPISIYNGSAPVGEPVQAAINNTTDKYLNFGPNFGNSPFVGPVGLVVTPAMGSTVLTGLRLYTANDSPERDPVDYLLEGSNDGGATYATVSSGPLSLPDDRNNPAALNPLTQINQEVDFANSGHYTTYRLSFANVKNNVAANSMQIGEVELLGTAYVPPAVTVNFQTVAGGQLQLQWSQGTLLEATNITGPWTTNNATSPYTVVPSDPQHYFRVKVQ